MPRRRPYSALCGLVLLAMGVSACGAECPSTALLQRVQHHEGFRATAEHDTGSAWVIGFGHDITATEAQTIGIWTRGHAADVLHDDLKVACAAAERDVGAKGWKRLTEARRAVLAELAFWIGGEGLWRFHGLLAAIQTYSWADAADQITDSELGRRYPERAGALAAIMREG